LISVNTTSGKIIRALTVFGVVGTIACVGCKHAPMPTPPTSSEPADPMKEAITKVEQDRGEAVGRKAIVTVPDQLKHYADRHRFLAIQVASSKALAQPIAADFADLVTLIERGELVEMKPLGGAYVLYGVGYSAGDDPFSHYDARTKQNMPLAANEKAIGEELQEASDAVRANAARLSSLAAERTRTPKRARSQRAALSKQVRLAKEALAAAKARNRLLAAFYADSKQRETVLAEHKQLSALARDFTGQSYDLNDSHDRYRLKVRLLSCIRPIARDVATEIAFEYQQRFNRPLPISSLVRPVQYQQELAATNPNASRGSLPPHSTGLAFDLYYRYMSAEEQEYLMSLIARLKDEGRIEALRETRDNIHVYVFGNGRPPDDEVIARAVAEDKSTRPRKPARRRRSASRR
jgi:Family of unknown function (DUF5715)